jgi:glycerophosphoryl diester phosphodiesterase
MAHPLIIARCGDTRDAPESTLTAFDGAIAKGADGLEFDVHLAADGELVIHHDYYLGRTNNGRGFIGDYTSVELRRLDAGAWFGKRFSGERIPTLSEVFDLGKGRIRFEIDMRTPNLAFLRQVLDAIAGHGVADDVELTSEHIPLLFHAKRMDPKIRVGVFFQSPPNWMGLALKQQHIVDWMSLSAAHAAHMPSSLLEVGFVKRLQNRCVLAHGSNLNTEAEIRQGIACSIDQFSTDSLELALAVRKELGATA